MDLKEAKKNVEFLKRQLISSIKNDDWSMSFSKHSSTDDTKGKRTWSNEKFRVVYDTSYDDKGRYEIYTIVKKEHSRDGFTELTVDFDVLGISRFRMWFLRIKLKRKGLTNEELRRQRDFESRMRTTAYQAKEYMTTHKGAVRDDKIKDLLQ